MTELGIETQALTKRFGPDVVVNGLDVSVKRGTVLALIGPNGSGKTTTVRMLATLLQPTSGSGRVCGLDLRTESERIRARIGLTGQFSAIDPHLSGTENVEFVARLLGQSGREARAAAGNLLERFQMSAVADQPVRTYSGGMRRRLDLAMTFLTAPDVLFLDEPTTGLDPVARKELWDLVRSTASRGCSVLLTTQYLQEADSLADDVLVLNHGRKVAQGTAHQLKSLAGDPVLTLRARADHAHTLRATLTSAGETITHQEGRTIGLAVPRHRVAEVIVTAQRAGVVLESLSLDGPNLDDVFRHLTTEESL